MHPLAQVRDALGRPAHYCEWEPYPARWLRNLARAGLIADGVADERSIRDLAPEDVATAAQFHAFAGIGVWSAAARDAGWGDDVPLWSGSCPCQPFSDAGRKKGFDDDRHLWPDWFRLISACRPPVVVGEQVASKDGLAWFDAVLADLEGAGYACRAFDLCAAGVGAPHRRQRLYFAALLPGAELDGVRVRLADDDDSSGGTCPAQHHADRRGQTDAPRAVGDAGGGGSGRDAGGDAPSQGGPAVRAERHVAELAGTTLLVGDTESERRERPTAGRAGGGIAGVGRDGVARGFWHPCEWVACRDGKSRPVEPGALEVAHGAAVGVGRVRAGRRPPPGPLIDWRASGLPQSRAGMLRGYGNAIVRPLAAEFLGALRDCLVDPAFEPEMI